MGGETSREKYLKKLQIVREKLNREFMEVAGPTTFYDWARKYFDNDLIVAGLYQLLPTFFGYYIIETFRSRTIGAYPYTMRISVKSNVPKLNFTEKVTNAEGCVAQIKYCQIIDLPYYELSISIDIYTYDNSLGNFNHSSRTFNYRFLTKEALTSLLETITPIEWPNVENGETFSEPVAPEEGEEGRTTN